MGATRHAKAGGMSGGQRRSSKARPKPATHPAGAEKQPKTGPVEFTDDATFARHYRVTTRTVQRWRNDGMPCEKRGRQFLYRLADTDPWVELARQNAGGSTPGNQSPATEVKLMRERVRLKQELLKCNALELEARKAEGNILDRDEYELYLVEVQQQARDRFMRLPINLCKHVPSKYHLVLQTEGKNEVRRICEDMCRALAQGPKKE